MNKINKKGKILTGFSIRIIGVVIGAVGFFLLAYQQTVLGTALMGIGS